MSQVVTYQSQVIVTQKNVEKFGNNDIIPYIPLE